VPVTGSKRLTCDANNRVAPYKPGDTTYPNLARTFEYDAVGNLVRKSDPTYATSKAAARDWSTYDPFLARPR
jgi:hypothetical protein